ncbi:MAG: hypothetical protein ACI4ES_05385 [Roseburia sp.]
MKKKILIIILLSLIIVVIFLIFKSKSSTKINTENAIELSSIETIVLPNIDDDNDFTCTGLSYDSSNQLFYVGYAGKSHPSDESFKASIIVLSDEFDQITESIDCYKNFSNLKDIQGVALDDKNTLWFCSYGENLIRHIKTSGETIGEFKVKNPSGIAYSNNTDSLWILTDKELINYSLSGEPIRSYSFRVEGQDQLYIDEDSGLIYITAGINYQAANYVYCFDIESEEFELKYILTDSYAIEGITIIDGVMYILNDGFYHDAKIPVNQVNVYHIPN